MDTQTPLIEVLLTEEKLPRPMPYPLNFDRETGCLVEFYGLIRSTENGTNISALQYEAYPAMAINIMREKISALLQLHPCLAVRVVHRLGKIKVGESAIYVGVWSTHRASGFRFLEEFMHELKKDVPIWKVGVAT